MHVFFEGSLVIGRPRTTADLKTLRHNTDATQRRNLMIAVIDDEPFQYLPILQKHDFHIKHFEDITDIRAVHTYPIVLCDIRGVGKHFDSKFEGAHLISEIRKYYPTKVIYAYTGHQFDATYNKYFQLCDHMLKKDIDADAWVETLDGAIREASDPIHNWKRLRNHLLAQDIPLFHLMRLEDEYVTSLLTSNAHFPSKSLDAILPKEVRGVLQDFAATALKLLLPSTR